MSKLGGKLTKPTGFKHAIWIPDGCDYDPLLPDHFEEFCSSFMKFPDGHRAGQPIAWSDWQRDLIIRPTWGLRWKDSGLRTIRTRFFLSARKTAKSTLAAAEAVWASINLPPSSIQVDLYAVSKPQASIVFDIVSSLIDTSPQLDEHFTISYQMKKAIHQIEDSRGIITIRSGDAKAELGRNPDISYLDELLAQRNRFLFDAIRTSAGGKPESLFAMMTTPDLTPQSFAREEYNYAKSISSDRSINATYLPVIFEADKDDDPFDRKTWIKAAPALGDFLDENVYADEAARAKDNPIALHSFKVFRLALWAEAGTNFISMDDWTRNNSEFPSTDALREMPCFFGLDMSSSKDLSSLCVAWWDAEREYLWASWRHWSTEKMAADLDELTHGRWKVWRKDPNVDLTICPGGLIDMKSVSDEISELFALFNPVWIGHDSFRNPEIGHYLGPEGADLPLQHLHQGGMQMQAALERVGGLVAAGHLKHNGDPVAAWCVQNSEVKYDSNGYPKLQKMDGITRLRIDAVQALMNAVDRLNAYERDGVEQPGRIWLPLDYEESLLDDEEAVEEESEKVLTW